jgi:hypothetical protein
MNGMTDECQARICSNEWLAVVSSEDSAVHAFRTRDASSPVPITAP